jgi:transcription elongation factor Elf1
VLSALITALSQFIASSSSSHQKSVVFASELLGSVLLGLFCAKPDEAFIDALFFNGEAKSCFGCGAAILDIGWRVCPYCEKRLANKSAKDGPVLAFQLSSSLISLALSVSDNKRWSGVEPYNHSHLVAKEKIANCVLCLLSQVLTGTSKQLTCRVYNRWIDAILQVLVLKKKTEKEFFFFCLFLITLL